MSSAILSLYSSAVGTVYLPIRETTCFGSYSSVSGNTAFSMGYNAKAQQSYTTAIGSNTLASSSYAIALGTCVTASSSYAIAIGLYANASGNKSIAIGRLANVTQSNSISIGSRANCNINSTDSIVIGTASYVQNGTNCIIIGSQAYYSATSNGAGFSVAIGASARSKYREDVLIGYPVDSNKGYSVIVGNGANSNSSSTICMGPNARTVSTSANYSIAIGQHSLANATASCRLGPSGITSGNYATNFGYHSTAETDNSIVLGGLSSLSSLRCKVSLTVSSDERDKADFEKIENASNFIKQLEPITYVFNHRGRYIDKENLPDEEQYNLEKYGICHYDKEAWSNQTKKDARRRIGFSAQKVQEVILNCYGTSNYADIVNDNFYDIEDKSTIPEGIENQLSICYMSLIPFLIKTVQELSAELDVLEAQYS